jgi:hypothetical protein
MSLSSDSLASDKAGSSLIFKRRMSLPRRLGLAFVMAFDSGLKADTDGDDDDEDDDDDDDVDLAFLRGLYL